jgi:hypothetical protein
LFKFTPFAAVFTLLAVPAATAQTFVDAGTELEVGEEATVPFLIPEGPEVPVALTVTAIEQGDMADLADFELPAGLEDATPYYVRFSYTNMGEEDLANHQLAGFVGIDESGEAVMPSMTMGGSEPFSLCQNPAPAEMGNGVSQDGCLMFLIEGDLTAAGYRGNYRYEQGKNTEKDFPIYYDPVLWTAGDAAETPAKGQVIAPQG